MCVCVCVHSSAFWNIFWFQWVKSHVFRNGLWGYYSWFWFIKWLLNKKKKLEKRIHNPTASHMCKEIIMCRTTYKVVHRSLLKHFLILHSIVKSYSIWKISCADVWEGWHPQRAWLWISGQQEWRTIPTSNKHLWSRCWRTGAKSLPLVRSSCQISLLLFPLEWPSSGVSPVIYALQIWEPSILWGFFFCGGGNWNWPDSWISRFYIKSGTRG